MPALDRNSGINKYIKIRKELIKNSNFPALKFFIDAIITCNALIAGGLFRVRMGPGKPVLHGQTPHLDPTRLGLVVIYRGLGKSYISNGIVNLFHRPVALIGAAKF